MVLSALTCAKATPPHDDFPTLPFRRVHGLLSKTRVYVVPVLGSALSAHKSGLDRMLASYRSIPPTSAVRLAKPTSNLFRARTKRDAPGLDTSGLTGVLSVDPESRSADVAGMCTYEDLVAATLR